MTLPELEALLDPAYLRVLGGFHPGLDDGTPEGCKTLLLLGPDEPRFWPHFIQTPEFRGGAPDAMDRWSLRVVEDCAKRIGAQALFPFGGPPYLPFYSWALKTGRAHVSPIRFLVHDRAGLFLSFRGALALSERILLPSPERTPCATCAGQPCATACPVRALTPQGYDVAACKAYIRSDAGRDCRENGCLARRACPVSKTAGRLSAQSAYHMQYFIKGSP